MDKKLLSSLLIKQQSGLKQQNTNKIICTDYVFDQVDIKQCNSFCPVHVPIKYGFQIRSLIKNNHLSLWRFSEQDKNQIIYNHVCCLFWKS